MPAAAPTARLEARISFELHATLKRAAELQGRTMTDFVIAAIQEAAQKAIVLPTPWLDRLARAALDLVDTAVDGSPVALKLVATHACSTKARG